MFDLTKQEMRGKIRDNLVKLRDSANMTQEMVAQSLGVNSATYRNWESKRDRGCPNLPRCIDIVKMYRLKNIEALIGIETDSGGNLSVACESDYDSSFETETNFNDLDPFEKIFVMQTRRLTKKSRNRLGKYLLKLLDEEEGKTEK